MKFLLFNVAVAAALVFLFTAERGEVQKIAGQVHDAAGDMKAYANQALDNRQPGPDRRIEPAPVSPSRQPESTPDVHPRPTAAHPDPSPATLPETPPNSPLSRKIAKNLPAMPEAGSNANPDAGPTIADRAGAGLDPAVAKRRREVLDGIETADAAPALKDGAGLMTPSERRRELLMLAEEMELLYARSISQ